MPKEYIEREKVLEIAKDEYYSDFHKSMADLTSLRELLEDSPTADVVEVDDISEQIIIKKSQVSDYWQNDVKQYRAMQGYSDIEHDVDNFLRGYNEAVKDILDILDGTPKERGGEK